MVMVVAMGRCRMCKRCRRCWCVVRWCMICERGVRTRHFSTTCTHCTTCTCKALFPMECQVNKTPHVRSGQERRDRAHAPQQLVAFDEGLEQDLILREEA